MKICNLIFFTLIGVCIGGMVYSNLTPQHTSTVSGTSGDLNCTTSCVTKEK
jgi:hypothetical protein